MSIINHILLMRRIYVGFGADNLDNGSEGTEYYGTEPHVVFGPGTLTIGKKTICLVHRYSTYIESS